MERDDKFLPQFVRCDKVRINNRKRRSVNSNDMVAAKKKSTGQETDDPIVINVLLFVF